MMFLWLHNIWWKYNSTPSDLERNILNGRMIFCFLWSTTALFCECTPELYSENTQSETENINLRSEAHLYSTHASPQSFLTHDAWIGTMSLLL